MESRNSFYDKVRANVIPEKDFDFAIDALSDEEAVEQEIENKLNDKYSTKQIISRVYDAVMFFKKCLPSINARMDILGIRNNFNIVPDVCRFINETGLYWSFDDPLSEARLAFNEWVYSEFMVILPKNISESNEMFSVWDKYKDKKETFLKDKNNIANELLKKGFYNLTEQERLLVLQFIEVKKAIEGERIWGAFYDNWNTPYYKSYGVKFLEEYIL
jgi:hypothetical protein